ncbi:Vacuolar protein sorting-associated protein Ist1 [Sesbania bispinosa]|nr:Vacuolar protein sorting-associated protein Ist1 [Sesbania bispinosa]
MKIINTRLEAIRKKRNAVQKFLKKDIADLLRSSLDYNAYGRAEGLLIEQNMSACYELVAKFVGCISDHVRDLCKHKDCPDECKEAIPSLIYAAARFSDLPELRHLRTLFTEKYGNSLEPYISKEFVEKLKQNAPSKEMKIQLLHDLAQEFSIEWDSKALEQRLYSPPLLNEEKPKHDLQSDYGDVEWHKNNDVPIRKIDKLVTGGKQRDGRDFHPSKGSEGDSLSPGMKDISDALGRLQSSSDDETTTYNSSQDGPKACSSSLESLSEDEVEIKRPFSYRLVPPPYVKENFNKSESTLKKTSEALPEKESNHDHREPVVQNKPIPRSVRRRPLKPPPDNNTASDSKTGDPAKLDSGGMRSEKAKQNQRTELAVNCDSRDEEEKTIDGLLMHYSKKQSPYESDIVKAYTKDCPLQQLEYNNNGPNRRHAKSNSGGPPVRGTSLPLKDTTSVETLKGHGRATSLLPEMLRTAGHVHPSLPDYDDFTARLAALRGR